MEEGIGTLIIGKNPFWKQGVELGHKHNQEFVQIPHARFIDLLTYKAALVGIRVVLTEESYTSQASFLDRDPLPSYDPAREEHPHFSGKWGGRWYRASGNRLIHSDVNGAYNIGRKVVPTAFGRGDRGSGSSAEISLQLSNEAHGNLCHEFLIL